MPPRRGTAPSCPSSVGPRDPVSGQRDPPQSRSEVLLVAGMVTVAPIDSPADTLAPCIWAQEAKPAGMSQAKNSMRMPHASPVLSLAPLLVRLRMSLHSPAAPPRVQPFAYAVGARDPRLLPRLPAPVAPVPRVVAMDRLAAAGGAAHRDGRLSRAQRAAISVAGSGQVSFRRGWDLIATICDSALARPPPSGVELKLSAGGAS